MSYQEASASEQWWNVIRTAWQHDNRINACFVCKTRPSEPFRVKDLSAGQERAKDLIGLCRFHESKFTRWLESRPISAPLLVRWLDRRHTERAAVLRRRWQKPVRRKHPTRKRFKWSTVTEKQRQQAAIDKANGF